MFASCSANESGSCGESEAGGKSISPRTQGCERCIFLMLSGERVRFACAILSPLQARSKFVSLS
jgi:hypothetical protein